MSNFANDMGEQTRQKAKNTWNSTVRAGQGYWRGLSGEACWTDSQGYEHCPGE
ncbi:MAG: hypothetical protein M3P98_02670 [bacterium]|nr:hypothetical protein [bacterium]